MDTRAHDEALVTLGRIMVIVEELWGSYCAEELHELLEAALDGYRSRTAA